MNMPSYPDIKGKPIEKQISELENAYIRLSRFVQDAFSSVDPTNFTQTFYRTWSDAEGNITILQGDVDGISADVTTLNGTVYDSAYYRFKSDGFHVYSGGINIWDGTPDVPGNKVFYADESGKLTLENILVTGADTEINIYHSAYLNFFVGNDSVDGKKIEGVAEDMIYLQSGKSVSIYAFSSSPDTYNPVIHLLSDNRVLIESGGTTTLNATDDIILDAADDITITADGLIAITAVETVTLTGSEVRVHHKTGSNQAARRVATCDNSQLLRFQRSADGTKLYIYNDADGTCYYISLTAV